MKTLDRSRPFGTIYPIHEGASFEQDGLFFDAQGNQCGAQPAEVPAEAPAEKQAEKQAARKPGRPRKSVPEAPEAPTVPAEAPAEPVNPEIAAQLADDEA